MPLAKLKFKPGINKETTSYSNQGGWNDCDLVRFRFGYPEKIGGWEKYSTNSFLGDSRSLHPWANLQGNKYLGIGTEIKFYIEESQGYNDITPVRRKVVGGEVIFDLDGATVAFFVSGLVGTTALGSETSFTDIGATVTGVTSTTEIGTVLVQTDLLIVTQVGTVTLGGDAHEGGATSSSITIDVNG
tara:strand:+ start:17 stop:577 length:561 start_codon:yes stop_codon:yes gene_type:complete